jgi:hypothetical protein
MALTMGAAAGFGGWISTDQTPASFCMAAVCTAFAAGSIAPASWSIRLARAAISAIVAFGAGAVFYLVLLWTTTGGAVGPCLEYWWKFLPEVQFWYFGGPPNPHFRTLEDFNNPGLIVLGVLSFGFHIWGIIFRKPGQWPLRAGLAAYGIISLLPLLGMCAFHYFAGIWCTGLIAVIYARRPERFRNSFIFSPPAHVLRICLAIVCIFMTNCMLECIRFFSYEYPEQMSCSLWGEPVEKLGDILPPIVEEEFKKAPSSNFLRAFYRTTPEIALGQAGIGRFDYIIHALAEKQQAEFRRNFEEAPPLYLRVPIQLKFSYTQWLWHQWPELWEFILSRYDLKALYQGSAYWRRCETAKTLRKTVVGCSIRQEDNCIALKLDRKPSEGSILQLTVSYKTTPPENPLAGSIDKLTRVTLRPEGVVDSQAFSWPPGPTSHTRQVLLLPKPDAEVEVRFFAEGLFVSSVLELESVKVEEIEGVNVVELAKTLKSKKQ